MKKQAAQGKEKKMLKWWQLSMIGVGCTIGTGFFLGSGLGIKLAGPAVLIAFLIAGASTYFVYDALAAMTQKDPQKGSFRTYSRKAFGRPVGFMNGWIYWFSEMFIVGSQLTAISLFSRFWFPEIQLWVFASIFGVLGLVVILIGTKLFEQMENVSAIVKVAAILMFIIIAVLGSTGVIDGDKGFDWPHTVAGFFPTGWKQIWASLIFAFFAFGGIEVIGIMSMRLENKGDAPKAGKVMLLILLIIYLAALSLVVFTLPHHDIKANESPFLTVLSFFKVPMVAHIFNGALMIAGFSTMSASLYAVTTMLVALAEDRDAPRFCCKKGKLAIPLPAFIITVLGLVISIVLSLLMPNSVYEYFTTGASLLILYNWILILITYSKSMELSALDKWKRNLAFFFIVLGITGTLFQKGTRGGLLVSLCFVAFIGLITFIVSVKRIRKRPLTPRRMR